MKTVTIHEAKTHLSKYIQQAKQGQKIYIGGFGKAEVVLTAVSNTSDQRDFSLLKDKISATPDAFSSKTDQQIADLILGE